jgi:hypothetical protein
MHKTVAAAALILSIFAGYAEAFDSYKGPYTLIRGVVTGQQYLTDLDEHDKMIYVTGVVDGFFGSTFFGAKDIYAEGLKKCLIGMQTDQLAAILTKYLKDHPEEWDQPAHKSMYVALLNACRNR